MTELQQRFIAEYLKDGNGKDAAVRAGYARKAAKQTASELLRKAHIVAALDAARAPVLEALRLQLADAQITMESHLCELAGIRDAAKKAGQYGAANAAEANRGKVAGLYVDRSIVETRELPALIIE